MPYPLGAIAVSAGATYTIPVGSAGTVGAVVIANESPFSVQASAGAGGQWIVAQTTDLVACNVAGFNGNLTLVTDSYLSNASEAPSFLLYLTVYAPGEAIRGTFPAPLMRLASGNLSVGTNAGVTLEQDLFTAFVLTGIVPSGVGTQIYSTTGGIAFTRQSDSSLLRTAVGATSQGPLSPSTTYFHDLNPDGTFSLGTSHSSQPNYLTIATITTDAVANISAISDTRVLSTLLFTSMANVANAPGLVVYNLHVDKNIQADNQISVQGGFITTSGVGGTYGWQIVTEVDSELEFWPLGPSEQFLMFNVFNSGAGRRAPFAIGSGSSVLAPLSWIDDNGVLHATAPVTLAAGNQETGVAGYTGYAPGAGNGLNYIFNFKTVMTNTPTSLTSSNLSAPVNANSLGFNLITKFGTNMFWSATAAGISTWAVQYTTVGNCLLAVDGAAHTFDHHCDGCGATHRAVPLSACGLHASTNPLESAISYICPDCGQMEHFNCALSAVDEADTSPQGSGEYQTTRGAQATLIRALMTALGLEVAP